jgi:hypothetical protein
MISYTIYQICYIFFCCKYRCLTRSKVTILIILDVWQVPHISGRFCITTVSNLWQVPLITKYRRHIRTCQNTTSCGTCQDKIYGHLSGIVIYELHTYPYFFFRKGSYYTGCCSASSHLPENYRQRT